MSADLHPQELKRALDRARERYFMALEARKALPPVQEDKMDSQRFTAEDLRRMHWQMQDDMMRYLSDRVRKFQSDTGLAVQGIGVEFATVQRLGEPTQNVVASVDVRVGLGR